MNACSMCTPCRSATLTLAFGVMSVPYNTIDRAWNLYLEEAPTGSIQNLSPYSAPYEHYTRSACPESLRYFEAPLCYLIAEACLQHSDVAFYEISCISVDIMAFINTRRLVHVGLPEVHP